MDLSAGQEVQKFKSCSCLFALVLAHVVGNRSTVIRQGVIESVSSELF